MIKRRILVALLTVCLTITSCISFVPQVWAETAEPGIESDQPAVPELPGDSDTPEPDQPAEPEDPGIPEPDVPDQPITNSWDENGFYHGADGEIVKNTYLIVDNKLYKFDKAGASKLYTGVYKNYYYNKGIKVTKHKNAVKKMSNGKFYCFNKNGTVFKGTGWKRFNGKRYYVKKGTVYTGWHYIGNYKYYFRKDNARLCQDLIALQGSKWKKKDLFIKVNRTKNCVTIYAKDGNKGYTIPVKALTCSVGKKSSPTITGTYTLKSGSGLTYRWHTLGGPGISPYCYGQYCVRIHKSWLFHSVTYDEPDNMTLQTYTYNQLGTAASHGCVRLQVKDAKLIYDIVKNRNTKVKIYDSNYTGPFDKPVISKIPKGQKYDPTDLSVKK